MLTVEVIDVDSFKLLPGDRHLNCSIFSMGKNYYLAYRREDNKCVNWDYDKIKVDICICQLDNSFQPIPHTNVKVDIFPSIPENHAIEDPRVFWHQNKLFCSYVNVAKTGQYQGLVELNPTNFLVKSYYFLNYGKNKNDAVVRPTRQNITGAVYKAKTSIHKEKNWTFFSHPLHGLCFSYKLNPNHVVRVINMTDTVRCDPIVETECSAVNELWDYGNIWGGTPALLDNDMYCGFFHSYTPLESNRHRQYHMGFFAFEKDFPFKMKYISKYPILSGELYDNTDFRPHNYSWRPAVVFPCGLVSDKEEWLVSYGHQDCLCKIAKISKKELLEHCEKI